MFSFAFTQARLRFSEVVGIPDVDEALRLMDVSKASLLNRRGGKTADTTTKVYNLIKERFKDANGRSLEEIPYVLCVDDARGTYCNGIDLSAHRYQAVEEHIIGRGYTVPDLEKCLKQYEHVLTRVDNRLRWLAIE